MNNDYLINSEIYEAVPYLVKFSVPDYSPPWPSDEVRVFRQVFFWANNFEYYSYDC